MNRCFLRFRLSELLNGLLGRFLGFLATARHDLLVRVVDVVDLLDHLGGTPRGRQFPAPNPSNVPAYPLHEYG